MKLTFNGVNLSALGDLRLLESQTTREPVEAPQRERVTLRWRLDVFQQAFRDNHTLIEALRSALSAGVAALVWADDGGSAYLERTVTASNDSLVEEPSAKGGTYWQAIGFTFWYYNFDLGTDVLAGVLGGQSLGKVEKWTEALDTTRWEKLRDARREVTITITASGVLPGNTAADLATRRAALLEAKDALVSQAAKASTVLSYGPFNRSVRVNQFRPEVDQPNNLIAWSLSAYYTLFADEADYYFQEVRATTRESFNDGIVTLSLQGRVGAATEAKAHAQLISLRASLTPPGYVTVSEDSNIPTALSSGKTGSAVVVDTDATGFHELGFTVELRETAGKRCTYQRPGVNTPLLDLGTVDRFSDGFSTSLFDEMRDVPRRMAGRVSMEGWWPLADGMTAAAQEIALTERERQFMTELQKGTTGRLIYGSGLGTGGSGTAPVFDQVIRVLEFTPRINRLKHRIEWTLSGLFTRFPNENDYALCEIRVATTQDRTTGTVMMNLSGRIGAQSADAARAKLARLRTAFIPSGFVLKDDRGEEARVEAESSGASAGTAFLELQISETWQKAFGGILSTTVRHSDEDDSRSGMIRSTYSGSIIACGAGSDSAFAAASSAAASLGGGKYPFILRSVFTEVSHQVLTDGLVINSYEFLYEYLRKGTKVYTEVNAELQEDVYGQTVVNVSGFIAAPDLATAQATYAADVRNVPDYSGALLLSERTLVLSEERVRVGATTAALFNRYTFLFAILKPKSQTAISYEMETAGDLTTLERRSVVSGTIFAPTEAGARTALAQLMTGLSLGKRLRFSSRASNRQGPSVLGPSPASVFVALTFQEEWVDLLTGVVSGILESTIEEEIVYAGDRIVERGIPDGPSVIQHPGIAAGRRVISGHAIATTEATARAWALNLHKMLSGIGHEFQPQVRTRWMFLNQVAGVARGAGANVRIVEVSATFSELLPEETLV